MIDLVLGIVGLGMDPRIISMMQSSVGLIVLLVECKLFRILIPSCSYYFILVLLFMLLDRIMLLALCVTNLLSLSL